VSSPYASSIEQGENIMAVTRQGEQQRGDREGVERRREADRQSRTLRVSSTRGRSDVDERMGR
jgi:hypothetical protein